MDSTVIRVTEARELLAYVPFRLGFRPAESLVAVSLRVPGNEVGLVVRLDLSDLVDPASGARLADAVADHLRADGAGRVLLVVYAKAARAEVRSCAGAAGRALARVRSSLPPGLLADVWLVGPAGYTGVDCVDEDCCPERGRPLAELESTRIGAEMVLAGAVVAPARQDLALRRRAPSAARRAAGRAAARARARHRSLSGDGLPTRPADHPSRSEKEALACWEALLSRAACGEELPAPELGRLLVALEDVALRDALILSLVPGDAEATSTSSLDAVFLPGGSPPAAVVVRLARAVLEDVVAHAPTRRTAPALTVLAWLAWWAGEGARSGVLVSQALAVDPAYRLARLLDDALGAGLAPGWARRTEPARWQDRPGAGRCGATGDEGRDERGRGDSVPDVPAPPGAP